MTDDELFHSSMAAAIINLDLSDMSKEEQHQLVYHCENASAGLCHCLNFIGDTFITLADEQAVTFTPHHLQQLGHSLKSISQLLPALSDLGYMIRAELQRNV